MRWIVEKNIYAANGEDHFLTALKELNVDRLLVDYIPFSHEIDPVPTQTENVIVMGSTNMIKAVKGLGWTPGVWHSDEFRFESYREHFGKDFLNADGEVMRFGDVALTEVSFVRPCEDLKSFAGGLVHPERQQEWMDSIVRYNDAMEDGGLSLETPVVVASVKDIIAEYRFFVVNGRVVTGCRYRLYGMASYHAAVEIDASWDFAQMMVDQWQPATGFVIDIATTPEGIKVIEINCLNSAGLYACDAKKIIAAIETL
jgi:hypothetical protein